MSFEEIEEIHSDNPNWNKELTPKQYFDNVKGLKNKVTKDSIEKYKLIQDNLMKKATALGQTFQLEKLDFISKTLELEVKLIDKGIDTFVYKEDILAYADKITDKSIKIIELKNYPREIPDEIAEVVVQLKQEKLFDEYFVIYTDYAELDPDLKSKIEKERDPILFGTFIKNTTTGSRIRTETLHNRFYYIADWIDEYCDLTLTKMIDEMAKEGKQIEYKLSIPVTKEEVNEQLIQLEKKDDSFVRTHKKVKIPFFSKVKSFFKGGK